MEPPREIHVKMVQANIDTLEKVSYHIVQKQLNRSNLPQYIHALFQLDVDLCGENSYKQEMSGH